MRQLLAALVWAWLLPVAQARTLVFESPPRQVAVLELFTSHGCSSCPPADAWLSHWRDSPLLWKQLIPLAFHVDYWDDLGWPDRFASPVFSRRQRAYHQAGLSGSVYTPGFMLRGLEWRGWFRGQTPDLEGARRVGRLTLRVTPGQRVQAGFAAAGEGSPGILTAHLALLGFGLVSEIGGGENTGHSLREDFVVLGLSSADPDGSGRHWTLAWPTTRGMQPPRQALVVWLSRVGSPVPYQAAGGWVAGVD